MLELIVARGANGAIGNKGAIPWHIPEDFKHFKETTMGGVIIMGRKTWESIGQALPGRINVVLTRNTEYQAEGAVVKPTLDAALQDFGDAKRLFIIGGATLYKEALSRVSIAWVTEVDIAPAADAFFPTLPETEWKREVINTIAATDKHPSATICKYTHI